MTDLFDPSKPNGSNDTIRTAISVDGSPELAITYRVAPRNGSAVRVKKGQILTIVNTQGTQVCDFWAFVDGNLNEYISMDHLHTSLSSIFPKVGDALVTNFRRPLMTIVEDTSPGVHDTLIACCDHQRYQQLGCTEYHDNCADNMRMAVTAIGQHAPVVPAPFNLWMNVPVTSEGDVKWSAPVSMPGDKMSFRAEVDSIAVLSACPQDITPVNGDDCEPCELHFSVR